VLDSFLHQGLELSNQEVEQFLCSRLDSLSGTHASAAVAVIEPEEMLSEQTESIQS
jgi:hypothetical protein